MNNKQRKTLAAIQEKPTRSDIEWKNIESLLLALGAEVSEGAGSRVRIKLNGIIGTFHKPHPRKIAKKYQVDSFREFLEKAGVGKNE